MKKKGWHEIIKDNSTINQTYVVSVIKINALGNFTSIAGIKILLSFFQVVWTAPFSVQRSIYY